MFSPQVFEKTCWLPLGCHQVTEGPSSWPSNALKMQSRLEDLVKSSTTEVKRCNVRHTFNISLVLPPGPGDEPDGASLKHVANNFAFRFHFGNRHEIQNFLKNRLHLHLRSACAQFLQSGFVLGCQRSTCEFCRATCPLCCLRLAFPLLCVGGQALDCAGKSRKAASMSALQCPLNSSAR